MHKNDDRNYVAFFFIFLILLFLGGVAFTSCSSGTGPSQYHVP